MAIPATATEFVAKMDPYEMLDWKLDLRSASLKLLEEGEQIASFTLTMGAEGTALGASIMTTAGRVAVAGNNDAGDVNAQITFWTEVSAGFQENAAFTDGVRVPITVSVTTNNSPSRKRQRTAVLEIIQQ